MKLLKTSRAKTIDDKTMYILENTIQKFGMKVA